MNIPKIGLGTYKLDYDTTYNIIINGIKLGYRHIDTAQLYKNKDAVGKAINDLIDKKLISRSDVFITTKVLFKNMNKGRDAIIVSIKDSLAKLGLGYIDLVLLHAPNKNKQKMIDNWITLQDIYLGKIQELKNKIKFIGVSNFNFDNLNMLLNNWKCYIKPFFNQIELHPFCYNTGRQKVIDLCEKNSIKIVAHSCLVGGYTDSQMVNSLDKLCQKYNMNINQLLIQWIIQKGWIIIIGTSNIDHLGENIINNSINTINNTDINYLDNLNLKYYFSIYDKYIF